MLSRLPSSQNRPLVSAANRPWVPPKRIEESMVKPFVRGSRLITRTAYRVSRVPLFGRFHATGARSKASVFLTHYSEWVIRQQHYCGATLTNLRPCDRDSLPPKCAKGAPAFEVWGGLQGVLVNYGTAKDRSASCFTDGSHFVGEP